MSMWRETIDIDEVPDDKLRDLLQAMIDYMKVEIVREQTPDYTFYELKPKT